MPAHPVDANEVLEELIGDWFSTTDSEHYLDPEISVESAQGSGWLVDKNCAMLTYRDKRYLVQMQEVVG